MYPMQPMEPHRQWPPAQPASHRRQHPQQQLQAQHQQVAHMRAGHADRERTVDVLKAAYAEGRLSREEYEARVESAYGSQTYGQLAAIVGDLPSGPMPTPMPLPVVPPTFAAPPRRRQVNGMAIAALALGLAEFVTAGLTAPAALVCGYVSRQQIRERDEEGSGMATAGVVLGWMAVAGWALFLFMGMFLFAAGSTGPVGPH
jgi:hypothetical protein